MANASLDEETAKKVIRQVEFYFSDTNLPRDNFLKTTVDDTQDGLVSLALICSFSRMRGHLGLGDAKPEDISEDTSKAVAETLRTSSFLKISEDGKRIGRAKRLPKPEEVLEQDERTVAASPLEYDVKLEDVESFFGQIAKVDSVRLPCHVADKRLFCGTARIEFASLEDATNVCKQTLVYGGVELELKPKSASVTILFDDTSIGSEQYASIQLQWKDFDAERAKQEAEVGNSRSQMGSNHKSSSNAEEDYPKGVIIAFTLKKTTEGGYAVQTGSQDPTKESVNNTEAAAESDATENVIEEADNKGTGDVKNDDVKPGENIAVESEEKVVEKSRLEGGKGEDGEKSLDSHIQKDDARMTSGVNTAAVMYKDNKDVVLREDLKIVFQKFGTVKFIDFSIGEDSGYIRFEEAEAAQKARASAVLAEEGGLIVKNYIAIIDPVTGESEREYWSSLHGKDRFRDARGNRGRGGKYNRGGRQYNGKHSRSRENNYSNRQNKSQKVGAD